MENNPANQATENGEQALKQAALEFGRRVRRLRKEAGLTQKELADRIGQWGRSYHQTTVAKIESGTRPTSLDELIPLSVALGVSQRAFFEDPSPAERAERKVREAEQRLLELRSELRTTHARFWQVRSELETAIKAYSLRVDELHELDPSTSAERRNVVQDLTSMVTDLKDPEEDVAPDRQRDHDEYEDLTDTLRVDQWPA